ncbi:hypothetical protein chiPu_0024989, partial [Chiloscyllium punctatum]|nr:hypothetical protein [Chiloscyllium punctatum]
MENFKSNYKSSDVRLVLLVNGYEADTAVTVRVRGEKEFHQELALGPGQTGTVEVTPCNEVTGSQLTTKTVTLSANKGVTVTSLSAKPLSADTAVVPPLCALGTTYYVFTPPTGAKEMLKEFGVVNAGTANRVTVRLSQAARFEGHLHPKGDTLTLSLAPYQSALIQSQNDLTGTKVEGSVPFALVSGHSCSMVRFKCNHVYEHLPPVGRWGTEYVAVPTTSQRKYDQLYVVASEPTMVRASTERAPRTLKEGEASWFKLSRDWPVVLSADKPIMVLHFSPGGKRSRNTGYDPFLTVLAPSPQFASSYVTQALHGFRNFLTVVARTGHTGRVLLDQREVGAAWKAVPNAEYSWAEVELGSEEGRHEVRAADNETIGVYVHGTANMNAYGSQGNAEGQQGSDDPCSLSQCGSLPHCARWNGSVCWAFGDPHYRTFDGVVYDFQGTCTYTFAKSCVRDPSLPAFSIHTRNDNRGSSRVSLTMMVTVEVYGHTITALKTELGRVR